MGATTKTLRNSPALVRAIPFLIFAIFTACQGQFGEASRYWVYITKTVVGAGLIWTMRPLVPEMKWVFSWEALVVGVGVFAVWVGLDNSYPAFDQLVQRYWCPLVKSVGLDNWCPRATESVWNPHAQFGANSPLAWSVIAIRALGSSLVVPPLEEVFYRSFLYRWILRADIETIPLGHFDWKPFLLSSIIFGLAHQQWLAGILCGFAYQGLVCWKNRLGDAITAHAITNFLLALWVVWRNAWNFW